MKSRAREYQSAPRTPPSCSAFAGNTVDRVKVGWTDGCHRKPGARVPLSSQERMRVHIMVHASEGPYLAVTNRLSCVVESRIRSRSTSRGYDCSGRPKTAVSK